MMLLQNRWVWKITGTCCTYDSVTWSNVSVWFANLSFLINIVKSLYSFYHWFKCGRVKFLWTFLLQLASRSIWSIRAHALYYYPSSQWIIKDTPIKLFFCVQCIVIIVIIFCTIVNIGIYFIAIFIVNSKTT